MAGIMYVHFDSDTLLRKLMDKLRARGFTIRSIEARPRRRSIEEKYAIRFIKRDRTSSGSSSRHA